MVRRYDEPVDVQARPGAPDEPDEPTAFVWRGRLYVVRGVLAHWYERRAWWRDTASLTLLGLRADGGMQDRADGAVQDRADGAMGNRADGAVREAGAATAQGTVAAPATTSLLAGAGEREVWRVEAAAGRSSPVGVYELVRDPLPGPLPVPRGGPSSASPGWRLTRVDD
jgi:hypothetical protein